MKKLCLIVFAFLPFVVDAQNIITIAGNGATISTGDGGLAIMAGMNFPVCIEFDKLGNCYVGEGMYGLKLRKITSDGIISTVAGTGISGYSGDGGPATLANIKRVEGVTLDDLGNIYIADKNDNRVRKIDAITGIISTVAGTGVGGYNGDGIPATSAKLYGPDDLCFDKEGNLYIADWANRRVRKIDGTGIITTVAGIGNVTYFYGGDGGPADTTAIRGPMGICMDEIGNLYIADNVSRIMKVDTAGIITTYAGNNLGGSSGDGGSATAAGVSPWSLAMDKDNNLYFSEFSASHKVRKVSSSGIVTTVTGTGVFGFSGDGGVATVAELNRPMGVAVDTCGNLFICDAQNYRIREVLLESTCPDTMATTGNSTNASSATITFFPNPVNDELHISGITVAASYSITDMVGKNLLWGALKKGENVVGLKALPPGVYMVMIVGGNGDRVVRRVRKE